MTVERRDRTHACDQTSNRKETQKIWMNFVMTNVDPAWEKSFLNGRELYFDTVQFLCGVAKIIGRI